MTQTETYCTGWFANLSSKFVSVPATKLTFLAGIDRLDRDLTVRQMWGKIPNLSFPVSRPPRSSG